MNSRYIGALILAPLGLFLFLGGIYLKFAIMVGAVIGLYELYSVASKKDIKPFKIIGYTTTVVYFVFLEHITFDMVAATLIIMTMLLMCVPAIEPKYNYIDVAVTILGLIYVPVFFSLINKINYMDSGKYLLWLVFLSSWSCDTAAYYSGKFFGKHKLCPRVSPKKTIEGSIGGLLGSILACTVFGFVFLEEFNFQLFHFAIIGGIAGVFCQFGDLAASGVKRHSNVKDYSNLIPGHGGILDRFDSILFSSVVVFFYLTYILNL